VQSVSFLYADITNSRLGVGTTSPGRRLDVLEGNVQIVGEFRNTSTTSARIKFTDANTGAENVNIGAIGTSLVMWTNNAERARIVSGGNFGINTTNPQARLHVNGTVRLDNEGTGPVNSDAPDINEIINNRNNPNIVLGVPDIWLRINIDGTNYVFPGYTEP
jgi:hypothetical protein